VDTSKPGAPRGEAELATLVRNLVAEMEPLHVALNQAMWLANITGGAEHERESVRLEARLRLILSRREPFRQLRAIGEAGGAADPALERQRVLLMNALHVNQVDPEMIERMVRLEKKLESRFNNFRAMLDGQPVGDNALRETLRDADDPALRRRAWEASKQIGAEVVGELMQLVRLRNEAAREIGFASYYTMMLNLKDEMDEDELFRLLDELDRGTRPAFEAYKQELDARLAERFRIAPAGLRPWHHADPFFQEAPAAALDLDRWFTTGSLEGIAERFFSAIGFDVRELIARADLYEREGKCQHAFCMSMDRGADVRVLCNLRPNEYSMSTLLHEFGHGVYDLAIDRGLPFLLREPAHTFTTEASAMLFGRLSKHAAWLTRYAGMPAASALGAGPASRRAVREQLLVQTRWELVMIHMERALYQDPDSDLNRRWWDLVERFQQVRRPEGRDAPDWAAKIHFSVAPVYYHNYLLGELLASQLQRHLQHEVLGGGADVWGRYVTSPDVGRVLTERLYRGGRSRHWRDTLRFGVGADLGAEAFVEELDART
jgi:peptidyl-dipeptidase A